MELKLDKNKLKNLKPDESAISVFTLIVFLAMSWFILSKIEAVNEDIPNYDKLTTNPYSNIENLIKKDKSREIIKTEQFKDLIYEDNLVKDYKKEKEGNLFEKKF
jgi:hypothetical protein